MANICTNTVLFDADPAALAALASIFDDMVAREAATGQGQLPPGVGSENGLMFAIDRHEATVSYETRSIPNFAVIAALAERVGAGFTITFHEPGEEIYGDIVYLRGGSTQTILEPEDFESYRSDPDDEDLWHFEGQTYEAESDILELLLERRREPVSD